MNDRPYIIPIGTETACGRVEAVGSLGGERYYWIVDGDGLVSMIPQESMSQYMLDEEAVDE